MDAANELISALVMGLWNSLTRHQARDSPFRLTRIETAPTRDALAALALMRVQEIEGFVHGLFGREEEIDLPERAHRALDDLGKMRALFGAVQKVASCVVTDATLDNMAGTLRLVRVIPKNAGNAMTTRVLYCQRPRSVVV